MTLRGGCNHPTAVQRADAHKEVTIRMTSEERREARYQRRVARRAEKKEARCAERKEFMNWVRDCIDATQCGQDLPDFEKLWKMFS